MSAGLVRDALTLLLGVGTGVLSGLFGVGGAVISTPGVRALGASAQLAVGTTLPSIIPGAASGTASYWRSGLIDRRTVMATAPAGVVATVGGSFLSQVVPGNGHVLMLATAALLFVSSWRMRSSRVPAPVPEADTEAVPLGRLDAGGASVASLRRHGPDAAGGPPLVRFAAVGGVAGLLSGLLGIGGGIVMVPGFTEFAGLNVKQAIATSLACVGLFAVPATITHAFLGDIDWRLAVLLAVGVVPGARLGSALAMRAGDRRLRAVVSVFLGITAVVYATGELAALVR